MEFRPIKPQAEAERPAQHCTDCLFCLVFAVFIAAVGGIAAYGFVRGDPSLILYPFDISGNQCGRPAAAARDYPYLYYVDPLTSPLYTVCVRDCAAPCATYFPNTWVQSCVPGLGFAYRLSPDNTTAYALEYTGSSFLDRFCMPRKSTAEALYEAVSREIQDGDTLEWAQDIVLTWSAAGAVLGASLVLSLAYMGLLRWCTALIVYGSILAVLAGLVGIGLAIRQAADAHYSSSAQHTDYTTLTYLSYGCYGLSALFALVVIFMWRRIRLAIAVLKCAVDFFGENCSILLVPFFSFVLTVAAVLLWLFALGFLYACGSVSHKDQYTAFGNVTWDETTRKLFYFEAVAIVWIVEFVQLLTQLVLALVVCSWYFDSGSGRKQHGKICAAVCTALRYHLGSVALASLILTLVKLVKWLLYYVQKHVYNADFQGNQLVKYLCVCVSCYVACFERFVQYIDKNALITMAYSSQSFCRCAQEVFELLSANAARFLAIGSLGELLSLLGRALITVLSAGAGFLLVTQTAHYADRLTSPVGPVVVFAGIGYCVSTVFMSVFEMACDCVIVFYLEDEKRHGTKAAMNAPEPLHRFMAEERSGEEDGCCPCL